jgi:acetyl esterase/lipase
LSRVLTLIVAPYPLDRLPILRYLVPQYVPDGNLTRPHASPLFADLQGLPQLLVQVGDHEVLLDDSVRFAEKARKAGVDVELEVWPEMWHGWHMSAPSVPEANAAIDRIGTYVRTLLSSNSLSRD